MYRRNRFDFRSVTSTKMSKTRRSDRFLGIPIYLFTFGFERDVYIAADHFVPSGRVSGQPARDDRFEQTFTPLLSVLRHGGNDASRYVFGRVAAGIGGPVNTYPIARRRVARGRVWRVRVPA